MKITLHDDETTLPANPGDHIVVRTGAHGEPTQRDPIITTDIHCIYAVGGQTIDFMKNVDSVSLRFEDALLWAVKYADTVGIGEIHAVFSISRPIDTLFFAKLKGVHLCDNRRNAPEKVAAGVSFSDIAARSDRLTSSAPSPRQLIVRGRPRDDLEGSQSKTQIAAR